MKRNLIIFLITMIIINISYQSNDNIASSAIKNTFADSKEKLIKCKVCQEMFEFNFNFDEFMKSTKVLNIKNTFGLIEDNKDELETYFSNDNMEFITKEISMQYFFKGTESEFNEASANNKECKTMKAGTKEICDKLKFETCEKVLSFENGTCLNFKKVFAEIFNSLKSNRNYNKSNLNKIKENEIKSKIGGNLSTSFVDDAESNISEMLKKIKMPLNILKENTNNKSIAIENKQMNLARQNLNNFIFKQKTIRNPVNNPQQEAELDADNLESKFSNMSLIELKQDRNFPNVNVLPFESHDNINTGRTWTPPKPVLLDNFQSNIGNQLKDISILAR